MNPEDMAKHELERLQVPLTEAEIAELVQATGMLGRRLAYQHDRLRGENENYRQSLSTLSWLADKAGTGCSIGQHIL